MLLVLTTTGSRDEARAIAAALVERRLAACVQISRIDSVFEWNGEVQDEEEYRLLVKTTEARYAAVEAAIRELHSYELPAIVGVQASRAYAPFADWVAESTAQA